MANKVEEKALELLAEIREQSLTRDFIDVFPDMASTLAQQLTDSTTLHGRLLCVQALAATLVREREIDFDAATAEIKRRSDLLFNNWQPGGRLGYYKIFASADDKVTFIKTFQEMEIGRYQPISSGSQLEKGDLRLNMRKESYEYLCNLAEGRGGEKRNDL